MPKLIEISIPTHKPGKVPAYETIGPKLDELLKRHFIGKKVVIRCIGSQDHPDMHLDTLTDVVMTTGTDKYDSSRTGFGYGAFVGKGTNIDFYGEDITIASDTAIMSRTLHEMYYSAIGDRGYAVHVDLVLIYNYRKLDMVMNLYDHHETSDGFVFKDPDHKQAALLGVIKITG
ncbi:MAG TPA: hypothetical protein VMB52_03695 [Verrucomicrobiae bacterium]|nr:hypothetical protein [Verrucomicrobiae bacterium]